MKALKCSFLKCRHFTHFYRYLFSYISLTTILVVIISGVVYASVFKSLQKQVESSNMSLLSQIRDIMDSRLQEMERISIKIMSNNRLTPSMLQIEGYDSLQIMKELQDYNSSSVFIKDILLFYKNKHANKIFASSGIYDIDDFFAREYKFDSFTKNDFVNYITEVKSPVMKPVEKVTLNSAVRTGMSFYMYPLPPNSNVSYGMAVFMIEEKSINKILTAMLQDRSGCVYVINENNQPIFSVSDPETNSQKDDIWDNVNTYLKEKPIIKTKTKFGQYSVMMIKSQYNNWTYAAAIPTPQFMQIAYNSLNVFVSLMLAVLILGLTLAYFLASKNYKPIIGLIKRIQGNLSDKEQPYYTDEFTYISDSINKVITENRFMTDQLKDKDFMLKEHFLINLLKGKYDNTDQFSSYSTFCNVQLDKYSFAVILFLIDNLNEFITKNTKSIQELLKFGMVNIVEELSTEYGVGFGINLLENNGIAIILGIHKDLNGVSSINELAFKVKNHFQHNYNVTLTAGAGCLYDDILMVQQSFIEASRATVYRFVKGSDNIISYDDIDISLENNKYKYPLDLEASLITAIKQGRGNEVDTLTDEIMKYIIAQPISPEAVQCICFGIISTIMKTLDEMNISTGSTIDSEMVELFTYKFETIENLKEQMSLFCKNICMHIENQKESKNFELRYKLINYIHLSYCKNTISLEIIADKFGLSPSYITRYFKDQTGYPLMKFIDNLRMDKAKELLKSTDLPCKYIMEQIGYIDQTNFIRKFKNNEGITPNQYRQLSR